MNCSMNFVIIGIFLLCLAGIITDDYSYYVGIISGIYHFFVTLKKLNLTPIILEASDTC